MEESAFPIIKPRFKGIENFLRRIAFNLGNTPSQTEVKIISCIPIDVTDLQNKIVDLERALDERGGEEGGETNVGLALGVPTFTPTATRDLSPTDAEPEGTTNTSSAERPSFPPESPSHHSRIERPEPPHLKSNSPASHEARRDSSNPSSSEGYEATKKKNKRPTKVKIPDRKKAKCKPQMVYFAQTVYPKKMQEEIVRRSRGRATEKTFEQAYLADVIGRQYQQEVVRCQYQQEAVDVEPSTSSRFSWPVCRDEPPASMAPPLICDSDMCSCCHGIFHNLDKMPTDPELSSTLPHQDNSMYYDSSLYDVVPVKERPSRIMMNDTYQKPTDIVLDMGRNYFPVHLNNPGVQFYQQPYITNYCTTSTPHRNVPKLRYKKKNPSKSAIKREQVIRAMQRRKHERCSGAEQSCSGYVDCGRVYMKSRLSRTVSSSPSPPSPPPSPPLPVLKNAGCLTMSFNEIECQTTTSCSVQIDPPPPPPPPPPEANKTEITLNQIKSILHAVLTEVKTSAQVKQTPVEDKPTKDAIVQNGPSHGNIAAHSSLLNSSVLYSPPYNYSCPYGPSFSGQNAGHNLYGPNTGVPPGTHGHESWTPPGVEPSISPVPSPFPGPNKCVQNYPLFIQTPARQCTCCYRSVPTQPPRPPSARPPPPFNPSNTQRETNATTQPSAHNNQTNNLIKEIYKSLTLNMNYPQKDNSSVYSDFRSSANASKKFDIHIGPKATLKKVASEMVNKGVKPSEYGSMGLVERLASREASYRSEVTTTATALTTMTSTTEESSEVSRAEGDRVISGKDETSTVSESHEAQRPVPPPRGRHHSSATRDSEPDRPQERGRQYREVSQERGRQYPELSQSQTATYSEEDTATPSIDSEESETTIVNKTEKKKKGIFSKMVNLFTGRSRRRRKAKNDTASEPDQEEPATDSDDYETVYSERSVHSRRGKRSNRYREPPPTSTPRRRRPHTKVSHTRYYSRREQPTPASSPRQRNENPAPVPPRQRRSPYMEQEYRRHWNENLMFHEGDTPRFSSERPFTRSGRQANTGNARTQPAHPSTRSPFWQEIEARHALVSQPRYIPPNVPPQPYRPPMYPSPPATYSPPPVGYPRPVGYPPPPIGYLPSPRGYHPAPAGYPPMHQPYPAPVNPYPSPKKEVSKQSACGQTEPRPMFVQPPLGKSVAQKGKSFLKKCNPGFQCGVAWKQFFFEG